MLLYTYVENNTVYELKSKTKILENKNPGLKNMMIMLSNGLLSVSGLWMIVFILKGEIELKEPME